MASDKAPAFQFYAKEFLADANQAGMSLQEAGAYVRLMCVEWNEAGKGIPDSAVKCARMVGATDGHMKKMWPTLRRCFREHGSETGMLIHPRLEKEREKQESYRRRQSDKGRASATARATGAQPDGNHGPTAVQPDGNQIATLRSPISNLQSPKNKKEPSSPKEPANPQVAEFLKWFPEEYKRRRHGADCLIVHERDGALVKKLLKTTTFERLQNLSRVMLSDKCEEKFITETGRDIGILSMKFNWLSDRLAAFEATRGATS